MFRLGPILYFRGATSLVWNVDVHVVADTRDTTPPPQLVLQGAVHPAEVLFEDPVVLQRRVYRWSLPITRGAQVDYEIRYGDHSSVYGPIVAPAPDRPPSIVFFSCNGFSSAKYANRVDDPQALWKRIEAQTDAGSAHLLLGGGDQIYADGLWEEVAILQKYRDLPRRRAVKLGAPASERRRLKRAYRDLYEKRWRKEPFASLLSRVPLVATWDDHDLFDGWGSYDEEEQASPVFQAVFDAAAATFDLFQCGVPPVARPEHRLQAVRIESTEAIVDLLLLDIRTHRTRTQVIAQPQWDAIKQQLKEWAPGDRPRHLLVVSSIPVVYIRFSGGVEEGSSWVPGGLSDDLRDQWESEAHRGERAKLLMNLLRHQNQAHRTRVTLLSGDVHVASRGRVQSLLAEHRVGENPGTIEQITASAILHAPPTWLEWQAIRALGTESEASVAPNVSSRLLKVGGSYAFRGRNYLNVTFDSKAGHTELWARWVTEGPRLDEAVVVHTP